VSEGVEWNFRVLRFVVILGLLRPFFCGLTVDRDCLEGEEEFVLSFDNLVVICCLCLFL
jgi:hypothetical protein